MLFVSVMTNIILNRLSIFLFQLTSQIIGGRKQSNEGAALFAVRVHLHC